MKIKILKPRKALKAFIKVKPHRSEIEHFKTNLIQLLDRSNDTESEEFHKNLVTDFLKKTYYDPDYFINTKNRNDLVIHVGDNAKSKVGVILEAKKPTNKSEMVRTDKLNAKAFQELVLYYLRERETLNNLEVKHLIITNIYEWFLFDVTVFDRLFAQNKKLVKQFKDFEAGRLADTKTDFFYKEIAEPFIANLESEVEFTYFDLRDYEKPLRNNNSEDDTKLIALFKLLSPEHLLKLPFVNDSNSLDKRFYSELLHIIGLTETKEGGKKLIDRHKSSERHTGTLLEDAIIQLDSMDKIGRLGNPSQYGSTYQERLFNVALELCITWINRILFLKLLEAQLIGYHKGDVSYGFLNFDKIKDYDQLNRLFFQVLARTPDERNERVKKEFEKVPYLNSSLFEPTEVEHNTLSISNLAGDIDIPLFSQTVIKDQQGKKRTGSMDALSYLFEFLNAYDFTSEGSEQIQEDKKSLINASVLGLIFEKINGYKDGSFFTPGFITMYMCRETIRKAVVQKFNEVKGWKCKTLADVYDKSDDRKEANDIVNSIKICDPAVGSGHFLVSALNEMIAVKHELKILQDRDGNRLKEYDIDVVNDELIITDEEGALFEYHPNSKESQRIQETLFHEKQTIIENCLFGVDINPNSVKICRLRLWIELLKNAYYIKSSSTSQGEVSAGRMDQLKLNNLPYLKTFRKELRNNMTPAEAKLWTLLKGKQMDGRKFRRQHSVANYILDFYCPQERIAIELDGQGHFEATQAEYDRERDLFLENFGIRVLRFENKWVWENPDELLNVVKSCFGKQPPRPADTLPSKGGELEELQTLPNIDINIKCGNSLVSRFAIDADLKKALKKSNWSISSYRVAVDTYRNAESKEQKREMERLIADIKSDFRSEIAKNDPKVKKLYKLNDELLKLTTQTSLFDMSKKEKATWNKKVDSMTKEIKKLETEIEEIKANKIFENAFEWRFEFPEVLNEDGEFVGFDVVIGNPPYFSLSKTQEQSEYLSRADFETYSKGADIYCIFYELGGRILKNDGLITYITSNSWLRAIYGELLKRYFIGNLQPISLLNIEDIQVFDEATVESNIITLQKGELVASFPVVNLSDDYQLGSSLAEYFEKNNFEFAVPETTEWFIGNQQAGKLKAKIETQGKQLKEFDVRINFGIKTGYNAAFIIDEKTKDELITQDPSNSEIIKPILRGRDLKKFSIDFDYIYLINSHNGLKSSGLKRVDVENDFPSIFEYFQGFLPKVEKRYDQGDHWSNLRNCAYLDDFTKPKIVWGEISDKPKFAYDDSCYYAEATTFIMTGEKLKFLLAILNSKVSEWYFNLIGTTTGMGTNRWKKYKIELLPIKEPTDLEENAIGQLVEKILSQKKKNPNADTTDLENHIDQLVYELYGLTEEEINIVEGAQ